MATILVVEDEPAVRNLVAVVLQSAGHAVTAARNGVEGIAFFRSNPSRFDLIVTDIRMPEMDGIQMVKLARETKAAVRIICMSGYSEQAAPSGTTFLQKPFSPKELGECVAKVLDQGSLLPPETP